jgi:hypothetical protein
MGMTRNRQRRRWLLGAFALAAGMLGSSGCLTLSHTCALPPGCAETCQAVPCACRGKVYVFLVDGFDPLDFSRVAEVRSSLIRAGFTKVYNGQFYHSGWFADELRRLHTEEPDARFVVVGFASGVEVAASLAESVAKDGVAIDLLASVDAPFWSSAPQKQPANVQQVMAVHGQSLFGAADAVAGQNIEIPAGFLDNVTAHPLTLDRLANALAQVAGTVPAPTKSEPVVVETSPTPRPMAARLAGPRDEWDFLKPTARLRDTPLPAAPVREVMPPGERSVSR